MENVLFYLRQNDTITVAELKKWLASVPDDAVIMVSDKFGDIRLDNFNSGNPPKLYIE